MLRQVENRFRIRFYLIQRVNGASVYRSYEPSQDFEPLYQCLEATNIIGYTDSDMSSMLSHRIRSNVVKLLGFRLGDGSAVVFQQHVDVMS